jgi:acetylornithine/succinyldiaminopimelate/putrescine aminotransferase
MSKKVKEKLTVADFMSELLAEVKLLNASAEKIARMAEIFERVAKAEEELIKEIREKGVLLRAR